MGQFGTDKHLVTAAVGHDLLWWRACVTQKELQR